MNHKELRMADLRMDDMHALLWLALEDLGKRLLLELLRDCEAAGRAVVGLVHTECAVEDARAENPEGAAQQPPSQAAMWSDRSMPREGRESAKSFRRTR